MDLKKIIIPAFILVLLALGACRTPQSSTRSGEEEVYVDVSHSATIPNDGSAPIAGANEVEDPDQIVTFQGIGEKFFVKNGSIVNFIYDGVDPELTYIIYESTEDGYNIRLAYREEPIVIEFKRLCQTYIVATPSLTNIDIPGNLKLEQVIWTPRADKTWEVRIGTVERGCKSQALKELQNMRSKDYEKSVPK